MPRRPALLTQAEVARAIRAARQAGAAGIEIRPDGTIRVDLNPVPTVSDAPAVAEGEAEIVL
jgi:hypothetical protein